MKRPTLADAPGADLRKPADQRDMIGTVGGVSALRASAAAPIWQATPIHACVDCLVRSADLLEAQIHALVLIVREAGKSLPKRDRRAHELANCASAAYAPRRTRA